MYQEQTGFFLSNRARIREFVSPLGRANEYAMAFDCRRELASFFIGSTASRFSLISCSTTGARAEDYEHRGDCRQHEKIPNAARKVH